MVDTGDSARAEEAQVARERAFHQQGEAQWATLIEQAEEEKKTAQQARLTSIREQPATWVRWLSATSAETRKDLAEAWLAEAWLAATEAQLAATETLTPAEVRREPAVARLVATEILTPAEARREPTEVATGAKKAASTKVTMDKPTRPPDRLNEQFTVTSAVLVQEPGEPAELKEPGGRASGKVQGSDGQCASSGVRQSGDPGRRPEREAKCKTGLWETTRRTG